MNARDFAVLTLDEKRLPGMPRQAFRRRSPVSPSDPRDRALAEHIVLGVVKNYLHLSHAISLFANRAIIQVDPRARLILAVALYQLRFLDRVPDHAAVAEAVRQTRSLGEPGLARAAGFVNAVLREALREPDLSRKLPQRSDAPAYGELVLSHPRPLFSRLTALVGSEDALRFCEHDNRTPPTLLRLTARGSTELLHRHRRERAGDAAPADSFEITPHEQPGMVVVHGATQADFAGWTEAGIGQVQDATSAAIVPHLGVEAGMTVLDRCSGVGTKTQQLAEAAGPGGRVCAVDAAGARISTLRRLVSRRADLSNITARRAEWMGELPAEWPRVYDRILIDAPCSNSGVLARRAEARYADVERSAAALEALQLAILRDTWPSLAEHGRLLYATCSVFPEENQHLVRQFLSMEPGAELVEEASVFPSFETEDPARYHDGGYWALLRRRVR